MTHTEIHTALKKIAVEELDWNEELPTGSLSASLDSMQKMSLVVGIEDHFHICFEPEEETSIDNIEDLISFIQHKKEQQTQS
jgi:acyl carrier protein